MKLIIVIIVLFALCGKILGQIETYEDNDFAEFEDFDSDDEGIVAGAASEQWIIGDVSKVKDATTKEMKPSKNDDFMEVNDGDEGEDDGVVEDDDNEFEHFQDEEEFEGFDNSDSKEGTADTKAGEPKLTVAKVPLHFRTHWDSYWMEVLMLAGVSAYFANFFVGKNKNYKIANHWLNTHRSLLEDNFFLVGDDGKLENESPGLMKDSESLYTLWCSGRTCCEGMLVEIKMIRRQDLVALVSGLMRPNQDQIHIKVEISKEAMDSFVFCVASKKTATKFFKEMSDLSKFCSLVNKPEDKYNVPAGMSVLSEIPEATSSILDSRFVAALNKYSHLIDYVHVSDQFSGQIQQEDPQNFKQPDVKRMLMAGFNLPNNCDMEAVKPLLVLVFYILERLKRYRLSKEGKMKADKNRLRVEEQFLKSTHAARAEAAAQRREEKRKQEKDRVLAEDDPEKQRRWEKKEQKRQAKKKSPKMKQLSIKSL